MQKYSRLSPHPPHKKNKSSSETELHRSGLRDDFWKLILYATTKKENNKFAIERSEHLDKQTGKIWSELA
jgi:hypothetical protein